MDLLKNIILIRIQRLTLRKDLQKLAMLIRHYLMRVRGRFMIRWAWLGMNKHRLVEIHSLDLVTFLKLGGVIIALKVRLLMKVFLETLRIFLTWVNRLRNNLEVRMYILIWIFLLWRVLTVPQNRYNLKRKVFV